MCKFLLFGFGLAFCVMTSGVHATDKHPARTVELALTEGVVTGPDVKAHRGVRWIRADQDEIVELRWTADENVVLHLHGYNKTLRLGKGATSIMRVVARLVGRFPLIIQTPVTAKDDAPQPAPKPFYLEVRPRWPEGAKTRW